MKKDSRSPEAIVGWTSNLLAVALVLVAALGLGRQLTDWWGVGGNDGASNGIPSGASSLDDPQAELTWRFGNAGRGLQQETFQGTREQVALKQREQCRQALESAPPEHSRIDGDETALLQRLRRREPLEQVPGKWTIHRFDGLLPLVAGIQLAPAAANLPNAAEEQLVAAQDRVLVWSLAVPQAGNRWTLYFFRAGEAGGATGADERVPLPPGCRRTLSLASARETTSALAGSGDPGDWAKHFDGWFAGGGWQAKSWRVDAGLWSNSFVPPTDRPSGEPQRVDVQFGRAAGGSMEGLLIETLPAKQLVESDE